MVFMMPGSLLYFDQYQARFKGEPITIGVMNTLRKVYYYESIT